MRTAQALSPTRPLLGQIERPAVFRTNRIAAKPAQSFPRGVLVDLRPVNCHCGAYVRSECICHHSRATA
ncbi:MAG TPA: hypothetical protein VLC92_01285 [Rhodocyclaceae bacterium]|nr:hypothetical protein [Rhodocyclaceae bacterium]